MKKLIPKRRFEKFKDSEAWEQRKLGDEVVFYSGLTYSPSNVIDSGGTLVLRSSNVKDGEIVEADNVYVSSDVVNSDNVQIGDVIVVVRNGSRSLIGKHAQIKETMKNTVIGAFMTGARYQQSAFLNVLLSTPQFYNEIEKNMGATINQITTGAFKEMKFYFPDIGEQKRIGDFFLNLDNLITLHQRKLKKLRNLKSAYLSEMFPKDGELYPKRRFAGFTDPWEQRKLGELAQYRRGSFPQPYGRDGWYDGDGAMPFVQVVDVTDQLELAEKTKQKISKLAQPMSIFVTKGSVIVTLQGSIGRVAITQYDCFVDRTLLIFERYNKPINEVFWAYTIQMKFDIEKEKAPGGTIKTITKEALTNFIVLLPSLEEQQKIGNFFNNLDNLITLHQRKLEKLEGLKQAYLSEMFI